MPDAKENDKVAGIAAAGDDTHLKESVKTLVFPASPGTQSFEWPEDAFSPSEIGTPSKVEFFGGRRQVRIVFGEQDPEKNPELFTPPPKKHRFFNPEYKWPSDEEAEKYVKFAFNVYHN